MTDTPELPKLPQSGYYLWEHPKHPSRVARPEDADFAKGEPLWVRCYPVEVFGGVSRAVSEWVSVEDRLPAVNKKVMFYRAEGFCFGWRLTDTVWMDDSFQDHDGFPIACFGITHWMPLPSAPATLGESA